MPRLIFESAFRLRWIRSTPSRACARHAAMMSRWRLSWALVISPRGGRPGSRDCLRGNLPVFGLRAMRMRRVADLCVTIGVGWKL
jgi:hypothetical protein